jgi:tRNA uridine 5-carbamoylmethylation protein Kti12
MPERTVLKKPVLIALAGLPAAGKSYFAERLGRLLDGDHGARVMVIASDTVRNEIIALKDDFVPEVEARVRPLTLERIRSGIAQDFSVIHDDLNYYRSMRFELVSLARELEVPHALVHIATSADACLKFNADRGRKIPDAVIVKDSGRFDPPGLDPWDEPLAVVEAPAWDEAGLAEIGERIACLTESYTPWEPPVLKTHTPSRREALDLLSRRVIGAFHGRGKPKASQKDLSLLRRKLVERADEQGLSDADAEALFRDELGVFFE